MQQKLGIPADGDFGPRTEAAVKTWQAANGLTADGIVGSRTMEKLFGK
jgi:peptidoglycan hydrolase-like protein with peptidoglycan-binding domain